MHLRSIRPLLLLVLATALVAGCSKDDKKNPIAPTPVEQVPDFSLIDANPKSSTYNTPVSPRQQLSKVSAWYFGHAS